MRGETTIGFVECVNYASTHNCFFFSLLILQRINGGRPFVRCAVWYALCFMAFGSLTHSRTRHIPSSDGHHSSRFTFQHTHTHTHTQICVHTRPSTAMWRVLRLLARGWSHRPKLFFHWKVLCLPLTLHTVSSCLQYFAFFLLSFFLLSNLFFSTRVCFLFFFFSFFTLNTMSFC